MAVVLVIVALAGCSGGSAASAPGGSASSPTQPTHQSAATIKVASADGLGKILVDRDGRTVYMFPPDERRQVTCTSQCAAIWPPVTVADGVTPTAGPGVRANLLGTVANPNPGASRVVTYNGWPLYTYVEDSRAGQATGQGLDRNGGFWFVMRPSGAIVK